MSETNNQMQRFGLDVVDSLDSVRVQTRNGLVDLNGYSEFKYGNGDVAEIYGDRLAERLATILGSTSIKRIAITSSAFRTAPPASKSMMPAMLDRLRTDAPTIEFNEFKINRGGITEGDYASKSQDERESVMKSINLSLPAGFSKDIDGIIMLDDIMVTGSHERAIDKLFSRSGLSELPTYYQYILLAENGYDNPQIEAAVNHCAIKSLSDVAKLSRSVKHFVPNARICKMLVTSPAYEIDSFCEVVERTHIETLQEYVTGDGLVDMDKYAASARHFLKRA